MMRVDQTGWFFVRAGRGGASDVRFRTPELAPLAHCTISMFGLGCLGAPCALEFARAGVAQLRILDGDIVDAGTIGRWPFGFQAAGAPKPTVIAEFIRKQYPRTNVDEYFHRLGATRLREADRKSDLDVLAEMTDATSIIVDATAEVGVQQCLADLAAANKVPYISLDATYGAWGGKVLRIIPGRTQGCWLCHRYAQDDGTLPLPTSDPKGEFQPLGCADPTFTGAGFDVLQIALTGVRLAVSTLCEGHESGYPEADWDLTVISLRNETGELIAPRFDNFLLNRHPECPRCKPI